VTATLVAALIGCSLPSITSTPAPVPARPAPPGGGYLFGTLLSDPARAAIEYERGVRLAHLELGWHFYQPEEDRFSRTYSRQVKAKLRAFQDAGMKVVLGVGLQYPPDWIFNYANTRYVDQDGSTADPVNLTFSQTAREKVEQYLAHVMEDLGPNSFWAVRIGSGGLIEALYPSARAGDQRNSYWAYDAAAQSGVGLPPTVPVSPYPGWKPGERTYNSELFSTAQVQEWHDWYLQSMVDGVNWQVATYKRLGFTGFLQVLMPGLGSRPSEYDKALAHYLDGTGDRNQTMGRAAVWHKVIDALARHENVVVYVSSMADGSGNNSLCQANDSSVSLDDTVVNRWSATRWLSYNADRYGMLKMGENPGRRDSKNYGLGMMRVAVQQMQSCGFQGLMWAHDFDLYEPGSGVTLDDYAEVIAQNSE
jgi:hypothetical protein